MSAEFDLREHEGVSYVRLRGVINGQFDAKKFVTSIRGPRVILNLSKLSAIEDGGRRLWRRALEHLSDHSDEVLLWDCPSELTEQFSDTPALLAQARVASYEVPYRCTSCEKNIAVRLDAATLNPDDVSGSLCRGCDGKLRVQRNPEILVDLRKHSAFENAALRLKNLVVSMERRFDESDFLNVHTASDLPDAFESTTSVLPAGSSSTRIDELKPIHREAIDQAPEPKDPEVTEHAAPPPKAPEPRREERRESQREAPSQKQQRLQPRPAGTGSSPGAPSPWRTPSYSGPVDPTRPDPRAAAPIRINPRPRSFEPPAAIPLIVVGLVGLILGWAIGFFSTDRGLPEGPIMGFTISLNEGDFTQAEAVLDSTKDELPDMLAELYRQELIRARADAADVYRRQAIQSFKEKRYDEAASYAEEAVLISDPEGKMLYLLADALRLGGRQNEALPHYEDFFAKFPEDDLADDAMYWRAETLTRLGQYEEAKELLERIMGLGRSNFKRAATKILLELP